MEHQLLLVQARSAYYSELVMQISGWGRFPFIDANEFSPRSESALANCLCSGFSGIARGMGRSYGDSSLAPFVINTRNLDHFTAFDQSTGVVQCQAGVTVGELLSIFAPRGWFLPVVPGTKFVTVGGMIASDVHGKNHHIDGAFSNFVVNITLALGDGSVITCSPDSHSELYHATCGGMGLTGVILAASLKLRTIESCFISKNVKRARNIDETIDLLEENSLSTYSVAWTDCRSKGAHFGRSLLILGEHASTGGYDDDAPERMHPSRAPISLPSFALPNYFFRFFNALYYRLNNTSKTSEIVHHSEFFFPLDKISNWNNLLGTNGFLEYQCVIPSRSCREAIPQFFNQISRSSAICFLAGLKTFGPANSNYLSFPMSGYTVVADFVNEECLPSLLNELDQIVINYGGRLYLTKDARMSEAVFKAGYPRWKDFSRAREKYHANTHFHSLQSQRLGI